MRLRYGELFARAGELWRADSELLVPVAAIFFFLPILAILIFLPITDLSGLEGEARSQAMLAMIGEQLPWSLAQTIVQTWGVGAILTLQLDPGRPSVGEAIRRSLVRLPGLLAARIIAFGGVALGILAFVVPGLYLIGRTFLTSALYIAEPKLGPAGAAIGGFERTAGNGWLLFLVAGTIFAANYLIGGMAGQGMLTLSAGGSWLALPFAALAAGMLSLMVVAMVLLEIAAYRGLARQGM